MAVVNDSPYPKEVTLTIPHRLEKNYNLVELGRNRILVKGEGKSEVIMTRPLKPYDLQVLAFTKD